jgi:hypothetical protein
MKRKTGWLAVAVACSVGCNCGPKLTQVGETDAGADAGADAEAGLDAGTDAGVDSGLDAAIDAGFGPDAGPDAGSPGMDAGPDAGMVLCADDGGLFPDASYCGVANVTGVSLQLSTQYADRPELLWNGCNYGAAWFERPQAGTTFNIFFNFISSSGQTSGSSVQVSSANGLTHAQVSGAWSGSEYGLTYYENLTATPYYRNLFARVDATGNPVPGSEIPLASSSLTQLTPHIAWNPLDSEFGVAWVEEPQGIVTQEYLYMARISDGAVVPGSVTQIRTSGSISLSDTGSHILIWTGSQYALTWSEAGAPYVGEITRTGQLTAASMTAVGSGVVAPMRSVVAFNGTEYGIAWMDYRTNTYEVHFGLANAGGGYVAGSDQLLGTAGLYSGEPDIVWDGSQFVVVWDEGTAPIRVWVARLTPTGTLVPGNPQTLTCSADDEWFPTISWNGAQHAVTYDRTFGTPEQSEQELLLFP